MSRIFLRTLLLLFLTSFSLALCSAQSPENAASKPANFSGKWDMSWTGRLGTEKCSLNLQQDSAKLKGTFHDQRGDFATSGTIEGDKLSFEVEFKGPKPFTTKFTGTLDGDKITGTSQAIGVGGSGAYLGHAGEVVQPEHPWSATRAANQPDTKSQNSPVRN